MTILPNGHTLITIGDILSALTLAIYNWIISYDAAHYNTVGLNLAIYRIIYAVICSFHP